MPMSLDQTEIRFSCYKEREIKSDSKVWELLYKEALDMLTNTIVFKKYFIVS